MQDGVRSAGFCMHRWFAGGDAATDECWMDMRSPLWTSIWIDHTSRDCRVARKRDNRNSAETPRTPRELNCVFISHESVLSAMQVPHVDLA